MQNNSELNCATEKQTGRIAIRRCAAHLAGARTDGPAGEAGAAIELCHVAKAVQTHRVCECVSVSARLYSGDIFIAFESKNHYLQKEICIHLHMCE